MAVSNSRENTFKVDLSCFPKRPSYEAIHRFVHRNIGLQIHQVKRLQINHALKCAHVKCVDMETAQDAVNNHDGRHEIEVEGKICTVRLAIDNGCTEVKIHDLSEVVTNEEIATFLRHYGDVHDVKELMWSQHFDLQNVPSGVRVVTMTLQNHIRSFVTIRGEPTLVTYKGQPKTCRHCTQLMHPGTTCVENKKRLKSIDENDRNSTVSATTDDNVEGKSGEIVKPSLTFANALKASGSNCTGGVQNNKITQQQQQQQQQSKRSGKQSISPICSPPRKKKDSTERRPVAPSVPFTPALSNSSTSSVPTAPSVPSNAESTTTTDDSDMETVYNDDDPEPNAQENLNNWLDWMKRDHERGKKKVNEIMNWKKSQK